jgi:hypothetical protein
MDVWNIFHWLSEREKIIILFRILFLKFYKNSSQDGFKRLIIRLNLYLCIYNLLHCVLWPFESQGQKKPSFNKYTI